MLCFKNGSKNKNDFLQICKNAALPHMRSVQKIRGLFELRGSNWFQEIPLGVARFVQIN